MKKTDDMPGGPRPRTEKPANRKGLAVANATGAENADKGPIFLESARKLTARQTRFVTLVMEGRSHAAAYREAYRKHGMRPTDAANNGHRVAQRPAVKAHLAVLRQQSNRGELLSLNERLGFLALIAQDSFAKNLDRIHAILAYTKIAGDGGAPEKHQFDDNRPVLNLIFEGTDPPATPQLPSP